jgi:hypothetical protein
MAFNDQFIEDSAGNDQAIVTHLSVPLSGCESHRFNVAMCRLLGERQDIVNQVQTLSIQLRLPNNSAALARSTPLEPIKASEARGSSAFQMLKR